MSLLKFGFITIFLSDSLVSGYTAAAAFTIMITQIKFLLGLPTQLAAIPSGPFVTPKVSQQETLTQLKNLESSVSSLKLRVYMYRKAYLKPRVIPPIAWSVPSNLHVIAKGRTISTCFALFQVVP